MKSSEDKGSFEFEMYFLDGVTEGSDGFDVGLGER